MNKKFRSMIISEVEPNNFQRNIAEKEINDLPEGDLLVNVKYSSLNYKDALSAVGNRGVTRSYPHTPGIDAAGIVTKTNTDEFAIGDEVLVTGYDFGMNTSGGFQQYIRVPSEWVIKLPKELTMRKSMIYGTAGFTAALSIYKLINSGIKASDGDILVTGATGGVGSVAISILSKLGYNVVAATGKTEEKQMLLDLGAKDIIHRDDVNDDSGKPMIKGRWAGVIDTVGGNILATAIKSTNYGGSITCCGNVNDHAFSTSVYPFILRGVTLFGIDSVQCPKDLRVELWNNMASDWAVDSLDSHVNEISLEGLSEKIDSMLEGNHKGRTIIKL